MQRCFDRLSALVPMLGVLGCSDPVPASSAVGLNLTLIQSANCPLLSGPQGPLLDDLGEPAPDLATGSKGKRVYDGDGGVSVSCTVRPTGNGSYFVSASVASRNPRVAINVQSGSIDSNGMGTALIGLSSQALPGNVLSPSTRPCTLNVPQPLADNVKTGAIFMHFDCPSLTAPPTYDCRASGDIVLENCKK